MATWKHYDVSGACPVSLYGTILLLSCRNILGSLLLLYQEHMMLSTSHSFLIHMICKVYTSALPLAWCRVAVGMNRLVQLKILRIHGVSSYRFSSFRYSGKEMICINASWSSLEVDPLVGLPRWIVHRTEPVLPVPRMLLEELFFFRYSFVNPSARVFPGRCRSRVFHRLRHTGVSVWRRPSSLSPRLQKWLPLNL